MPFTDHRHAGETPTFDVYRAEATRLRAEARSTALRRVWIWLQTSAAGLRTVERKPVAWPKTAARPATVSVGVRG